MITKLDILSAPDAKDLPVSVQDVVDAYGINDYVESLMERYIASAVRTLAKWRGYVIGQHEYRLSLDDWPCSGVIRIPVYPILIGGETDIILEYLDTSGDWQSLAQLGNDVSGLVPRVFLPHDLPELNKDVFPRVRLTFYAGLSEVDPTAHLATMILASHFYANPDGEADIPEGWRTLTTSLDNGLGFGEVNR